VLYTNIGAGIGNAAINSVEYEFSMKNVALLKPLRSNVNGYYLEFYLNNDKIKTIIIDNYSNGGAQKFLSLKSIAKIPVSLPPLPLQQSFASKIEAIERQKALVQQSITETETLFNSRMDYYFN
jgi:type I restriction enzyme S subunit